MSELIIHYSSLETAVKRLDGISSSLNSYADTINTQVSRKLLNYTGARTTYINDADGFARRKMNQLRAKAQAFTTYATKVSTFVVNAKQADMKIKSRVDELTGKFKAKYGIRTSAIDMVFSFINNLLNKTALGRVFKDLLNAIGVALDSILGRISDWYKYEGGKYILESIILGVLSVAIAVITLLTAGAVLAVIAAAILVSFAVANAICDFSNSLKAASLLNGDNPDPAWAQRYSKMDTVTDTMRKESDSKLVHTISYGLDALEIACNIVMITSSIDKMASGGFKSILTTPSKGSILINNVNVIKGLNIAKTGLRITRGIYNISLGKTEKGIIGIGAGILEIVGVKDVERMYSTSKKIGDFMDSIKALNNIKSIGTSNSSIRLNAILATSYTG